MSIPANLGPLPTPEIEVDGDLAERINREHRACEAACRSGLVHAVEAGLLLINARSKCKHGQWLSWLDENMEFSQWTATRYMRVAKHFVELEVSNRAHVPDLTFREALAMLAAPGKKEEPDGLPGQDEGKNEGEAGTQAEGGAQANGQSSPATSNEQGQETGGGEAGGNTGEDGTGGGGGGVTADPSGQANSLETEDEEDDALSTSPSPTSSRSAADEDAENWDNFLSNINLFFVSLPRRKGWSGLMEKWSDVKKQAFLETLIRLVSLLEEGIRTITETLDR
jgi:hypothetical protein